MEVDLTDEEYVVQRAKEAFLTSPLQAKAWMITAKTLYPDNFGVQVIKTFSICRLVNKISISLKHILLRRVLGMLRKQLDVSVNCKYYNCQ